jgi:hypothetical protein
MIIVDQLEPKVEKQVKITEQGYAVICFLLTGFESGLAVSGDQEGLEEG